VKKWIIAAGVVAAALVAVIVVTKPWPHAGGGTAVAPAEEEAIARLQAVNERAKEASRKLKEMRAKMQPFDANRQRPPYPGQGASAAPAAAAESEEHQHGKDARDPADLARHEKANDVLKADALGVRADVALKRPDTAPRWDAVAPLEWKRLGTLFTGFSIGYKMGGDFTDDVVRDLHGAAVEIEGAVLPIDPPKSALKRFWLVKPEVARAECVFCKPPSPGDLIYVDASKSPLSVDRKKMYTDTVIIKAVGRFLLGPTKTKDGIEYLYGLELKETK
jgi:hypothetical protein